MLKTPSYSECGINGNKMEQRKAVNLPQLLYTITRSYRRYFQESGKRPRTQRCTNLCSLLSCKVIHMPELRTAITSSTGREGLPQSFLERSPPDRLPSSKPLPERDWKALQEKAQSNRHPFCLRWAASYSTPILQSGPSQTAPLTAHLDLIKVHTSKTGKLFSTCE